jgi:tRNA (guanosine-2'-O-)-methyltransferase
MRRDSRDVVSPHALLTERIRRAESRNPSEMIRLLEPMVLEPRRTRLREVFAARLSSVAVVFDCPYDPHNGAAVMRTCDAFGIQTLHIVERATPFRISSTVARGAEKWLDLHCHKNAQEALAPVQSAGYELVCAEADGELEPADLAHIPKLALVLGNEHDGVSEDLRAACTRRVRVPMRGFVESLNVSVTAAILLQAATHGRKGDLSDVDRERLYARGLFFSRPRAEEVLAELDALG